MHVGDDVDTNCIRILCKKMASLILESIGKKGNENLSYQDFITKDSSRHRIEGNDLKVIFSGGVADLIDKNSYSYPFGDIGVPLGNAIYEACEEIESDIIKTEETIRATVIGAGMHTTEISGSTITCTVNHLPIKNIPIYYLDEIGMRQLEDNLDEIVASLRWFLVQTDAERFAIGFYGKKSPKFQELKQLTRQLSLLYEKIAYQKEIIVVQYQDCAKALGQLLDANYNYQ